MKYISLRSAVNTTRVLFKNYPGSDSMSLDDIYRYSGRDLSETDKNRNWLGFKLTHLKHHNLVEAIYQLEGKRQILSGIKLTDFGRESLNALIAASTTTTTTTQFQQPVQRPALERLIMAARDYKNENPHVSVISLKENGRVALEVVLE